MTSPSRLQSIVENQTGIARKVLDAVPISDRWDLRQIIHELHRVHHVRYEQHVVRGCLKSLRESGLVHELGEGFQRVPIRPLIRSVAKPAPAEPEEKPVMTPEPESPGDRIACVASKLRTMAALFNDLATELDDAVIAYDEQAGATSAEFAQLRQLKALLKGL